MIAWYSRARSSLSSSISRSRVIAAAPSRCWAGAGLAMVACLSAMGASRDLPRRPGHPLGEQEDQEHDHQQRDDAAGGVAPVAGVRPARQAADEQQDQDDQK